MYIIYLIVIIVMNPLQVIGEHIGMEWGTPDTGSNSISLVDFSGNTG